jgi:hypothetical protein
MPRRVLNKLLLALITLIFFSCNGGLEPTPPLIEPTGFSGRVIFKGNWPEGIKRTHLVAFKNPLQTAADFFPPNLSIIMDSIAYGTREHSYNSIYDNFFKGSSIEPRNYSYVVVAQSKSASLSLLRSDWTVAGVYYAGIDTTAPGVLKIVKDRMTKEINIICDFNNPPPQPPGGTAKKN